MLSMPGDTGVQTQVMPGSVPPVPEAAPAQPVTPVAAVMPGSTSPAPSTEPEGPFVPGEYLTVTDQKKYFAGCAYLIDRHAMLMSDGEILDHKRFKTLMGGHEFQMQADGSRPTRDAFECYTESRCTKFPKYRGAYYDPTTEFGTIKNGRINALLIEPVAVSYGDVTPFMDLMCRILPVERDRRIVLSWMAQAAQSPGRKFQWAITLQGAEGNGKSFLLEVMTHAIGESVTHLPNPEDMGEKYNDYLEGNLFLGVEEIHMRGRFELLERLKKYITGQRVEIRKMGENKRMSTILCNWMFLTNHKSAVITYRGNRRHAIFFTAQQEEEDLVRDGMSGDYFPNLYNWANAGGYADITGFLKTYQIDPQFDPLGNAAHRAPLTSSHEEAIRESFGPLEEILLDAVGSEFDGFKGGWVSFHMARKTIDKRYRKGYSDKMLADALKNIEYLSFGRSTRKILQEDNAKPILYYHPQIELNPTLDQYLLKQQYVIPQVGQVGPPTPVQET